MVQLNFNNQGCRPEVGVPDMTVISDIDEQGINKNLRVRYERDQIYTYTGSILVAVNPYKDIDIYSSEQVFKYHGAKLGALEPHVFALAEAAYRSLQDSATLCSSIVGGPTAGVQQQQQQTNGECHTPSSPPVRNQSCVISGESGAGKTETTKFILQYLCSVTSNVSTWVEQQILEANTILEAFGNAKTVRNDNSSRFGKFMQVCFDSKWMIAGCIIQDYLLEQSRITFQSPGERNYHVFYQLVEAGKNNKELAEQLHLKDAHFYKYLNQSGCIKIDGVSDGRKLDSLRLAFNVLQVPPEMSEGIFKVLAAILWLGNLEFEDIDGERCQLSDSACDGETLECVADLLGLSLDDMRQVVLLRQINVRGNITEIPLKLQEARENRHAMAKALYSRTFAWLINHINTCTNPGQDSSRFLGVLDIFGFENFAVNSFEQLCINYTNEKLHKFFNHYVFALEQEIYQQEEIQFSHIKFTDNTQCLELIEKPPRCILKLLTEQCHMPKGSDLAYLTNLHSEFESHGSYIKGDDRRKWEKEFGIQHYAGCVTYNVQGFVDKNRDVQQDVFFDHMSRSTNEFVQELTVFQDLLTSNIKMPNSNGAATVSRGTSKGKPTVSDSFRQQLQALVDVLQSTNPWYVRCIKPNNKKLPNNYNESMVLDQLKYLGMLDIIRIRKEGYPIHMAYEEFTARYHCLSKVHLPKDSREAVRTIIRTHNVPETEWQIGKSKIFLRRFVHEPLEDSRNQLVTSRAILIQKIWRGYVQRKAYQRIRDAALKVQHAYRGWKSRILFIRKRRAAIVIQSHLRGVFAREVAAALREMRRVEEEMRKREKLELERKQREAEISAKQAEEAQKTLEESERAAQEEIATLSQMAEQLNQSKYAQNNAETSSGGIAESVDLDNLFAFLSDVQPQRNAIIDEIGEKMDELVEDLDVELETVIQQELEGLNMSRSSVPPCTLPLQHTGPSKGLGMPTLPEPTEPPPPPPTTASQPQSQQPPPPPPPQDIEPPPTTTPTQKGSSEPIYESVLPRDEGVENDGCISPPPLPAPPIKFRSKSPGIERVVQRNVPNETNQRSRSPNSPRPSRPNSRGSANGLLNQSQPQQWRHNNGIQTTQTTNEHLHDPEREQRRKFRVEKKLQEMEEIQQEKDTHTEEMHHDIVEFAQNYFNTHEKSPEGTIIATLTRKSRGKSLEVLPKYEMVTYYKGNSIPNSHIHMYDPDNVNVACTVFKDLCKYLRGELNVDRELSVIQSIIGYGIEREELRDEILVQCMRQATNNPNPEWCERVWLLLCLCIVAFQPSKLLYKYFLSFLKKNLQLEGKLRQYVQWCLDNCKNTKVSCREYPPSSVEVAAMRRLGTIVCRFFFLDGRTKAIDVHPTDTAGDATIKLSERLGLRSTEGWAIYQSRPDGEEHVRAHHYLYDVIAEWEIKQNKIVAATSNFTTLSRSNRSSTTLGSGENRFIFKRRLFKSTRELSQDPVEVNMLYAQAVYNVVKCDAFPVTEKVALQLAGLQAQVALGDPKDNNKLEYYTDLDTYLPYRISRARGDDVWVPIIAQAHRQYGAGRSELQAKALYLSCVMQYPLYGTTMFPVTYRGYWSYGNALILGVNCEGLMLIKPDDKFVLYEYRYHEVESILIDPSDSFITISLLRHTQDSSHKCFVFETQQKNEIGSLIVSYYPALATWLNESEQPIKKFKGITNEDRIRLYHNLVNCRRTLVDSDMLRKPQDMSGGFLRNTLRRLSKHRLEKLRQEHGNATDHGETYKGFPYAFWAFSRQPIPQSITRMPEVDEQVALQVFQIVLTYSGLGQNGETIRRAEDEHVNLIQTIMERIMRKENLLCEFYMQLIKQTTDHPDPNSRVNLRHWALLSLACSVILPPNKVIRKYLMSHLKRCSSDYVTEEGKFARFAEKCLLKTQGTRRRQWPPSREEITCTINRRPIYARFHFMDGQYHSVEFHPSATARDVMEIVKNKIGLPETAMGYAIYEVLGSSERSLLPDEKISDVMSKWERYRTAQNNSNNQQQQQMPQNGTQTLTKTRRQHHLFLFKKHLFLDQYINLNDPVEKELLYHQVLHDLRSDRFPITEKEAMMLTALQAQLELGDMGDILHDYRPIASHCLAPRFVPNIPSEGVAMHHQSLRGMTSTEAKKAFLNLIQSWPLHRATIFDVMQSFTSNWPRVLWLAVDQVGLHLLEHRSRNALCTYEYSSIMSYSPALNCLMIITGTDKKQSKVILTTSQAFQIATLIREYTEVLQSELMSASMTASMTASMGPISPQTTTPMPMNQSHAGTLELRRRDRSTSRSRPVSILHKPAPLIEPQPS